MTHDTVLDDTPAPTTTGPADLLRDRLQALVGVIDASWEDALAIDRDFVGAYLDLAEVPECKSHLDAKTRALIALAVSASVTTLDPHGIATAAAQAARAGATREEALEAVHLVSVLGIHTFVIGVPVLAEVAERHGLTVTSWEPLTTEQERIRERFREQRGYWSEMNETLLRTDPEFFEAYTGYSSHPWVHGSLSPKVRELIYIAIDLAPSHLFTSGIGPHIENALRYGATVPEILEAMEVTAQAGIASVRAAAPIIRQVFGSEIEPTS